MVAQSIPMTDGYETAAVVGVAGGVGTTRITLESAATLARAGRDVVVLDVSFGTQGLVDHVPGTVDGDAARVFTEQTPFSEALFEFDLGTAGDLAVCPARAPFELLARAKTASAAQQFEAVLSEASTVADHVLIDVPPVATNPSVAAVTAADRVGVVVPPSNRGHDALQRLQGRLEDVGADRDLTIVNRATDREPIRSADLTVPTATAVAPTETPTVIDPDPEFAPAVADVAAGLFETELGLSFPDGGILSDLP